MDVIFSFGEWVRRRRLALDHTRASLAAAIGVSPETIKKIERDERRPSRQVAKLLAEQLKISGDAREQFIAMGRGRYVEATLSPLVDELPAGSATRTRHFSPTIPTFLDDEVEPTVADVPLFVGRVLELKHLEVLLDRAIAGEGGVAFVTGEAGRGKTSLLDAFSRRAQEARPDLVVAYGTCDVYTGVGDPFLPFRDALAMLAGDVESKYRAGSIGRDHALRLWRLMPEVVRALSDHGRELIGTLVSGRALLDRAASLAETGLVGLDELQRVVEQRMEATRAQSLEQKRLFSQVTAVLSALSIGRPLLLILDDLHWADVSSLGLLAHLGRRLADSPILLVGAYRPEEIAQGRSGKPHPLQGIVSEFKRYLGDIQIDLEEGDLAEARDFVDALLDTEPNQLGEDFRQTLVDHTSGQPLFTIELLRELQERGDLVKDEDGRWVESPHLQLDVLPPRVEGVIEKRLEHLDDDLRELLETASVEGEEFTVELLSAVVGQEDREVIRRLSRSLEAQHHLVREQGLERAGDRSILRYRFGHGLYRQYLYSQLSTGERRLLHGELARALEALYEADPEPVFTRLAHHYYEAGEDRKASEYLLLAAARSRRLFAYEEALEQLKRASELNNEMATSLEILRQRAKLHLEQFQGAAAIQDYEELVAHASEINDRRLELESLLGMAQAHYLLALDAQGTNFAERSRALFDEAYQLAANMNDKANMVRALVPSSWLANFWPDYFDEALTNTERAVTLSQEVGDKELVFDSTLARIAILKNVRSYNEAATLGEELRAQLEQEGEFRRLYLLNYELIWIYRVTGDFQRSMECADSAIEAAKKLGVPPVQYPTLRALALLKMGRFAEAWDSLQQEVADESHPFGAAYRAYGEALHWLEMAMFGRAETAIERAIEAGRRLNRPWLEEYGLNHLTQAQVRDGRLTPIAFEQIKRELESAGGSMWPLVRSEAVFAFGELEEALQLAEHARAEADGHGDRPATVDAIEMQVRVLAALSKPEAAIASAEEGIDLAEEMSYLSKWWQLLAAKAAVYGEMGDAESAAATYHSASDIIDKILRSIPDPETREAYLSQPGVLAVFQAVQSDA